MSPARCEARGGGGAVPAAEGLRLRGGCRSTRQQAERRLGAMTANVFSGLNDSMAGSSGPAVTPARR